MTRSEHLEWCKQRAYEYLDKGETGEAWASMASDLSKHDETREHPAILLGTMQLAGGLMSGEADIRRFIEGFN